MLFSIISYELGIPETRSGEFSSKHKYLAISIAQRVRFPGDYNVDCRCGELIKDIVKT